MSHVTVVGGMTIMALHRAVRVMGPVRQKFITTVRQMKKTKMITDTEIKEEVAPILKALIEAGFFVNYTRPDARVWIDEDLEIEIRYFSDALGQVNDKLTAEYLATWFQKPKDVEEFLSWFTIEVSMNVARSLVDRNVQLYV